MRRHSLRLVIFCCVIARTTRTAYRDFRWPKLDRFNWALDYFDVMARDNAQPALWLVDEDAGETKLSFAELSERSNRIANALRGLGVQRGDRILLMLGNVVPLWECMLAAMKLGAVDRAGDDATDAQRSRRPLRARPRSPRDCQRRCRGQIRRFARRLHAHCRRQGRARMGFVSRTATRPPRNSRQTAKRTRTIRCCSISPPARRRRRSSSCTAIRAIRSAISRRCIGSACGPATCISTFHRRAGRSTPGVVSFRRGTRRPTIFIVNQRRFNARGLLDTIARCGVTTFCAPPTVWRMLIQEDLAAWKVSMQELIGAGEPLNPEVIERVKAAWGLTIRDGYGQTETTALGRQYAGAEGQSRLDGPAAAGLSRCAARCRRRGAQGGRNLPDARTAPDRPDARLSGRRRQRSRASRRGLPHRRRRFGR